MHITLVPSAVGAPGGSLPYYLTSFVVNDAVAVDAGCLGFYQSPQAQAAIRHLLITHTHIDHIASLPIFVENAFEGRPDPVTVYATQAVLNCLQRDVFNDRLWPDFIALSAKQTPFLRLQVLQPGRPVEMEGLRVTPVPVNHVVPTTGFLLEDPNAAVLIVSDTGPTDDIWRVANAAPNLRAVFLEATFPDAMRRLAVLSKHLTPAMFAEEAAKVTRPVEFVAVHIKARFREEVVRELQALGMPNLVIGEFGKAYSY